MGGADLDAVAEDNFTALMWASQEGHLDSVRCLLEIKSDVNYCSGKFGTAMHHAAAFGHTEILKVTLRQ